MPVLLQIRERFNKEKPFRGKKIGACLHVTVETANLMLALKAGGAEVALCASNPLSSQDEAAAGLVAAGIPVFAISDEDLKVIFKHRESALSFRSYITMDDGAAPYTMTHTK